MPKIHRVLRERVFCIFVHMPTLVIEPCNDGFYQVYLIIVPIQRVHKQDTKCNTRRWDICNIYLKSHSMQCTYPDWPILPFSTSPAWTTMATIQWRLQQKCMNTKSKSNIDESFAFLWNLFMYFLTWLCSPFWINLTVNEVMWMVFGVASLLARSLGLE